MKKIKNQSGVKNSSPTGHRRVISDFIKNLGYGQYAYVGIKSIYVDKIGYYHLKYQGTDFKFDLELSDFILEHNITFIPTPGHRISGEDVEFIEALRNSNTSGLMEDIRMVNDVMYDCYKKYAYDTYKKGFLGNWDKLKKGKVLSPFEVSDYMTSDVYEMAEDILGVDDVTEVCCISDAEKAIGEGILEVWKEMTGRTDLYVDKDYICSR